MEVCSFFSVELLLGIVALNGKKKTSLHSLAFHSELFPTCSGAGTHGDWVLNFH